LAKRGASFLCNAICSGEGIPDADVQDISKGLPPSEKKRNEEKTMERKKGIKTRTMMAVLLISMVLATNTSTFIGPGRSSEAVPAEAGLISVGPDPTQLAVNPTTNMIYVNNEGSDTVQAINGTTDTVIANITVYPQPIGIAVNPTTNKVYVADHTTNEVSVINGTTNTVITTISVGGSYPNSYPYCLAVNPVTDMVYVTYAGLRQVSVINGTTDTVTDTISAGIGPSNWGVAVNPDTNTVYVTGGTGVNNVQVINGTTNTVTTTIPVGSTPIGVAVDNETNMVYVANRGDNTVSVINGTTNTVTTTISAGIGNDPVGVAVNPVINTVFVANANSNTVSIINGVTNSVTTIAVGNSPVDVQVNPLTYYVYVANAADNTVSVFRWPFDWWPMFHHDVAHTGYSTSTAPTTNSTIWTYQTDASVNRAQEQSSPAVADGMVFIGSMDNKTYALNATNGASIWNYTTGGGIQSSPTVADEKVFIGSDDNYVYALDEIHGTQIWNYTDGNSSGAVWSCPTVADGMVFVGSLDGNFSALNETNGKLIWYYTANGWIESSAAVADGMVFVGSGYHDYTTYDNNVYAFDETTGLKIWSYTTNCGVHSSPAVADGMVFVASYDGNVYALGEYNGTQMWVYSTGEWVWSSPAVAGGMVFVGSNNGVVYALNESNGNSIWTYATTSVGPWYTNQAIGPYGVESSPAVAGGIVYVGSCDNTTYALTASNGSSIWNYTTGWPVVSSPAVANGTVYMGSCDGYVYALGGFNLYNVTIKAHCLTEGVDVSVSITMDGLPTGYATPYTFTGLTGIHTFSVLSTDSSGHPFMQWDTGETNTTITVSLGGTYTAYYRTMVTHDANSLWAEDQAGNTSYNWTTATVGVGYTFTVEVDMNMTSTSDVFSWQVELKWPSFLSLTAISKGDYFAGHTELGLCYAIYSTDEILVFNCLFGSDFVIGHPGSLFYATFTVLDAPPPNGTLSGKLDISYQNITTDNVDANTWWSVGYIFNAFDYTYDFPINFTSVAVHDVAITNIMPSKTVVFQGYTMSVNVTAADPGNYTETFNVTVYANTTYVASQNVTLNSGDSTNLTLIWNATGFAKGIYTISAYAWPVPGETNTANNNFTDGSVYVSMVGDLTGPTLFVPDGKCDGRDITVVAKCFGSNLGDPRYNPNCDILNRGRIDGRDITIVAKNFGKHDP